MVAGVVVVVFAALGGCTRPAEVFGVVPAPAPLKVENIYSVQNILNKNDIRALKISNHLSFSGFLEQRLSLRSIITLGSLPAQYGLCKANALESQKNLNGLGL